MQSSFFAPLFLIKFFLKVLTSRQHCSTFTPPNSFALQAPIEECIHDDSIHEHVNTINGKYDTRQTETRVRYNKKETRRWLSSGETLVEQHGRNATAVEHRAEEMLVEQRRECQSSSSLCFAPIISSWSVRAGIKRTLKLTFS
jgi:hypothetical protein